uniref:Uncharacterized protein n=1 Tax=Panagrolaimus superbus TaxID=310955 RepID=A0A914YU14_9BILA
MADNEVPSDEGEIAQLLFDDTFYNPALKVSNVAKERGAVKKLMKFDEFPIYIARPFVETFAEEVGTFFYI